MVDGNMGTHASYSSPAQRHAILYIYKKTQDSCNTRSPASKSLRYLRINYELPGACKECSVHRTAVVSALLCYSLKGLTLAVRSTDASWLSRSRAISLVSFRRAFCNSSSACFRSLQRVKGEKKQDDTYEHVRQVFLLHAAEHWLGETRRHVEMRSVCL